MKLVLQIFFFVMLGVPFASAEYVNQLPIIDAYVVPNDISDLALYRVNIQRTKDPDGKIIRTEIDFGDGTISSEADVEHRYSSNGLYNISIRAWDNKNAFSTYVKRIKVATNSILNDRSYILEPKELKTGSDKFVVNLPSDQQNDLYKLVITKHHTYPVFSDFLNKFKHLCLSFLGKNSRKSVNVVLNDIEIFQDGEIAENTVKAEKIVKLNPINNLRTKFEVGIFEAYFIEVKTFEAIVDNNPPIVGLDVQSNTVTSDDHIEVRISDLSDSVTTYVWKTQLQAVNDPVPLNANDVNQLIITTSESNFSIPLTEGVNYFIIQSVDKYNNRSDFIYLNNIVLNSTSPLIAFISPAVTENLYTYSLPFNQNVYINFSKKVSSVVVNGVPAQIDSAVTGKSATAIITLNQAGENHFNVVATDLAGNVTSFDHTLNLILVTAAPRLSLILPPSLFTNDPILNFSFSVESQMPVKTVVKINNIVVFSTSELTETVVSNLSLQGNNSIEVSVFADVPGFDTSLKTSSRFSVTLDSVSPFIASSSPENNSVVYTNHFPINIPVSLIFNENLSNISVNGIAQPTFSNTYFTDYFISSEGFKELQINATDAAGNSSQLSHVIEVSFSDTLPILKFDESVKNLLTNQTTVPIHGTSDKLLSQVKLNGAVITVGSDGKSFSGVFNAPQNGRFLLEVVGTDRWGNVGTASTYIRVLDSLPNSLLPPTSPGLVYDPQTGSYTPTFGPQFNDPLRGDICATLDQVFSSEPEFKDNLKNLEDNLQEINHETAQYGVKRIRIPRQSDLDQFMGDIDEALNSIKAPYLLMCKGINIMPGVDCPTNRNIFKIVMGQYPEPLIVRTLPIPVTVQNFLIPRLNICTGFDSSNLTCEDMVKFLPFIADLALPGFGQTLSSPLGQAVTEAVLCKDICSVPPVSTVPGACMNVPIPQIPEVAPFPTPISAPYPPGSGITDNWGGGGGWPSSGGSSGCKWWENCGGGSGSDGNGPNEFSCSLFPTLWFCGNTGGGSDERIIIDDSINCSEFYGANLNTLINISTARNIPLGNLFTSYIAKCLPSSVPGYPNAQVPVLTVTEPVQDQFAEGTVRVRGFVNDVYAHVRINGVDVSTAIGQFGAYFDETIAVPTDLKIKVEAANLFGTRALPIEIMLAAEQLSNIREIGTGVYSACILKSNGSVACAGRNVSGVLGTGRAEGIIVRTFTEAIGLSSNVTKLASGDYHYCVIASGEVKCWGMNSWGQVGLINPPTSGGEYIPKTVPSTQGASDLALGRFHTCALINGGVQCWGTNNFGQLGSVSPLEDGTAHVKVPGLESGVVRIVAGTHNNCAFLADGKIKCWGYKIDSIDGISTGYGVAVPVPVELNHFALGTVKDLSLGFAHACALLINNEVYCWGSNNRGELGDGSLIGKSLPSRVNGLPQDQIVELKTGSQSNCAITKNSGTYCWGDNSHFSIGFNVYSDILVPTKVPSITFNMRRLHLSHEISCGLNASDLYCSTGYLGPVLANPEFQLVPY